MDSHKKSILKSISWRIVAVTVVTLVTIGVTGSWEIGVTIGIIDTTIKVFLYYAHERLWMKVRL